jgi:hypothetical protein
MNVRVPRPIRWLLILLALFAGFAAGHLLDLHSAAKEAPPGPTTKNFATDEHR